MGSCVPWAGACVDDSSEYKKSCTDDVTKTIPNRVASSQSQTLSGTFDPKSRFNSSPSVIAGNIEQRSIIGNKNANSTNAAETDVMTGTIHENVRNRGVSIKILRRVLNKWNRVKCTNLPNKSIGEKMVELIVKKQCAEWECSYTDMLSKETSNKDDLGRCNVFISHAWKYDFTNLMSAIEEFEKEHPGVKLFYFLDYLAINQFKPQEDLDRLPELVSHCDYFILVMLFGDEHIPVTRIWCIYETAVALEKKIRPLVRMPIEMEGHFKQKLMRGDDKSKAILEIFKKFDSRNAIASINADQKMIRAKIISEMGGFLKVDQNVGSCLRSWLITVILKINHEWPKEQMWSNDRGNFLTLAADFLDFEGKKKEALEMWEECVRVRKGSRNDNSEVVLTAKGNLAVAYDNLGMHNQAIVLKKQLVIVREATLGPKHLSTLQIKDSLALSYDKLHKYDKALKLKKQGLAIRQQRYGKTHNDVLLSKTNLAFTLSRLGRHKEVFNLNKEVYEIRLRKMGASDPDTLLSASNLANSFVHFGQYEDAVTKYKEAYSGYENFYGGGHEYTLDALSNLITSLIKLANFAEAKDFAEEGLALALKRFPFSDRRVKEFNETIVNCSEILNDKKKVTELKRLAKLESEAKSPDSVTVKAILSHLKKFQGVKPERRVNIPVEGMEVTKFIKLCVPNIETNLDFFYVENGSRQKLEHIPYQAGTVFVKSKLSCNVILTYLQKQRGKWPTVDVCFPKEGITKEELILKIDQSLDPKLYKLENKQSCSVKVVIPGTSVLWMKNTESTA